MTSTLNDASKRSQNATSWLIAEYAVLQNRLDLLNRYNNAVGAPSPAVAHVHSDFVNGNMEDGEMVAFVLFCEELIDAASKGCTAPSADPDGE